MIFVLTETVPNSFGFFGGLSLGKSSLVFALWTLDDPSRINVSVSDLLLPSSSEVRIHLPAPGAGCSITLLKQPTNRDVSKLERLCRSVARTFRAPANIEHTL